MTDYLLRPYRPGWSRAFWVTQRFVRKLVFAALVGGWQYGSGGPEDTLPVLVFMCLVLLLLVQVSLRPYADRRDNRLEVACLLLLIFGYFTSLLPGHARTANALVVSGKALVFAYGLWRVAVSLVNDCRRKKDEQSLSEAHQLAVPLLEMGTPLGSGGPQL